MKVVKIWIMVLTPLVWMGCQAAKGSESPSETKTLRSDTLSLVAEIGEEIKSPDMFSLTSCLIQGNHLILGVSYTGGCYEHEWRVLGSAGLMKSMPPGRSVSIFHNGKGDSCKGIMSRTLKVDIRKLAATPMAGDETILHLPGCKESLTYVYQ